MYVCLSVWKHILSIHSLCLDSTRILDEFKLLRKYEHISHILRMDIVKILSGRNLIHPGLPDLLVASSVSSFYQQIWIHLVSVDISIIFIYIYIRIGQGLLYVSLKHHNIHKWMTIIS